LFRHFLDPPVDGSILQFAWRGWDSNPRSRAHEAREDSRSSTARRSLTRAKIWSAGFEPAISDARSRWGGRSPLRPVSSCSPAGLEPATRGVEALCSSAELRGDRRPWNRTTLHRHIRTAPTQPARRRHSWHFLLPQLRRRSRRLQGSATPQAGIRAARFRSAESRSRTSHSLAGRIRTSVPHRRRVVLQSAELRRVERSRRESNPPHPGDSRAAPPGAPESVLPRECEPHTERQLRPRQGTPSGILAIENRGSGSRSAGNTVEPRGIEPRSGGCKPPSWPPRAPCESDRRDSNPVRSAGNAVCFRPDTTVASRSAPSGVRTRVTGVRDRHPGRLDDRGVWSTDGRNRTLSGGVGDRMDAMSSSVRSSSSGGIRTTHPSVQSRRSCR
jgi:hypothetical protein